MDSHQKNLISQYSFVTVVIKMLHNGTSSLKKESVTAILNFTDITDNSNICISHLASKKNREKIHHFPSILYFLKGKKCDRITTPNKRAYIII